MTHLFVKIDINYIKVKRQEKYCSEISEKIKYRPSFTSSQVQLPAPQKQASK